MQMQNQNAEWVMLAQNVHVLVQQSISFYPQSGLHHLASNFTFLLKSFTPGLVDSSYLFFLLQSSQQTLSSNENEQDQAMMPTAGLTPCASFSNLMVGGVHGTAKDQDQDLPPSSSPNQFHSL